MDPGHLVTWSISEEGPSEMQDILQESSTTRRMPNGKASAKLVTYI